MTVFNSDAEYKEINEQATNLNTIMTAISISLKEHGYLNDDNYGDINKVIQSAIKDDVKAYFPADYIEKHVAAASKLSNKIVIFNSKVEEERFFEVSKQKAAREAERIDAWKLWRDKLGRWVMGVMAAVLMYSALVALSKWTGWLVIPVRDLVVSG